MTLATPGDGHGPGGLVGILAVSLILVPAAASLTAGPTAERNSPGNDPSEKPYDNLPVAVQSHIDGNGVALSFAEAIKLGQFVGQHQVSTVGDGPAVDLPQPDHESPSRAVHALADRYEAPGANDDLEELQSLENIDQPLRSALVDIIDAFLAFDTAARTAYSDTVPTHATVFTARNQLLGATGQLHTALQATSTGNVDSVVFPPVLALDLEGTDTTYARDVALVVDVGGNDTYHNNAGGAAATEGIGVSDPSPDFQGYPAAALVDLGDGTDEYGNPDNASDRRYGVNGGAYTHAAGFLVDEDGNDTYTADCCGANGGGHGYNPLGNADGGASGFLLDAGGNDTYTTGCCGANGGAVIGSSGALLDVEGDDDYVSGILGSNGGAYRGGFGLLVEWAGDDSYTVNLGSYAIDRPGVNGGAGVTPAPSVHMVPDVEVPVGGEGLLFDYRGIDEYQEHWGGSGTDRTVIPKGIAGAQIDVPAGEG